MELLSRPGRRSHWELSWGQLDFGYFVTQTPLTLHPCSPILKCLIVSTLFFFFCIYKQKIMFVGTKTKWNVQAKSLDSKTWSKTKWHCCYKDISNFFVLLIMHFNKTGTQICAVLFSPFWIIKIVYAAALTLNAGTFSSIACKQSLRLIPDSGRKCDGGVTPSVPHCKLISRVRARLAVRCMYYAGCF